MCVGVCVCVCVCECVLYLHRVPPEYPRDISQRARAADLCAAASRRWTRPRRSSAGRSRALFLHGPAFSIAELRQPQRRRRASHETVLHRCRYRHGDRNNSVMIIALLWKNTHSRSRPSSGRRAYYRRAARRDIVSRTVFSAWKMRVNDGRKFKSYIGRDSLLLEFDSTHA